MTAFGEYAAFYNLMYPDKRYVTEAEFVLSELAAYKHDITDMLDLGCGTCTHAAVFARTGCLVHGVDLSTEMLELARKSLEQRDSEVRRRILLEQSDVRSFRANKIFDAVVSLFHVMSYQTSDIDVNAMIETARSHLSAGSPFLFDFWHGPAVLKSGPLSRRKEVEDDTMKIVRDTTPIWKKQLDQVEVVFDFSVLHKATGQVKYFQEIHKMRYFFPAQLERLLRKSGFQVKKCSEWETNRPVSENTFSAYMIAVAV